MSTEAKSSSSAAIPSHSPEAPRQDNEFVKGLGLTSATMLVMGSMIGSGIFIVSADIARQVDSPALLIAAWLVTGFMTIVAALSYGELAAMMPHAGGQYVYLRESLGPLWGFLYGWTLFMVIQTGTIAAVGVAWPVCSSRVMFGMMNRPRPYVETTRSCVRFSTTIHVAGAGGRPFCSGVQCPPSSIE